MRRQPSAKAKPLTFTNNQMRMLDGPFVESKELIGGFAVMELAGMDEAIAMWRRYTALLRRPPPTRRPRGGPGIARESAHILPRPPGVAADSIDRRTRGHTDRSDSCG